MKINITRGLTQSGKYDINYNFMVILVIFRLTTQGGQTTKEEVPVLDRIKNNKVNVSCRIKVTLLLLFKSS